MQDSEILSQMIKASARVPLEKRYKKLIVTLTEPPPADYSVIIGSMPDDAVVIKVDAFPSPDAVFSGSKGECRRADYVIVSQSRKRILYIELKKNKDSFKEVVQQLTGAKCFVSYCKAVGKSFWKERDFLEDYQHRFVSIGRISSSKNKMREDRTKGKHDSPKKAMRIDYPHRLQFRNLAGA